MYEKLFLRCTSFAIAATLLLVPFQGIAGADNATENLFKNYVNLEQKIQCEATLDDDFADDVVLVVLFKGVLNNV